MQHKCSQKYHERVKAVQSEQSITAKDHVLEQRINLPAFTDETSNRLVWCCDTQRFVDQPTCGNFILIESRD